MVYYKIFNLPIYHTHFLTFDYIYIRLPQTDVLFLLLFFFHTTGTDWKVINHKKTSGGIGRFLPRMQQVVGLIPGRGCTDL